MKTQLIACAGFALMAGANVVASAGERDVVKASGKWEMAQATDPGRWMPAIVPGTVLRTLVANKVVPDPFWGVNNRWEDKTIPDLSDNREFYSATFRTKVALPRDFAGATSRARPSGCARRA